MSVYKRAGFTLIELLVVVVIISILIAGMFRLMRLAGDQSDKSSTAHKVHALMSLAEMYKGIYGTYPEGDSGSIEFKFLIDNRDGGSIDSKEKRLATFGFLSNFVPRAKFIQDAMTATPDKGLKSVYQDGITRAVGQFQTAFSPSEGGGDILNLYSKAEDHDPYVKRLHARLKEFIREGIVMDGLIQPDPKKRIIYRAMTALDAWERPLRYTVSGENAVIYSAGPDGTDHTADDISSLGRN